MPTQIHLRRIEVLPSGRVALTLREDPKDFGRYIYRAAAEIEWQPEELRFIGPRSELGSPSKHFAHVATAASDELGYVLTPNPDTEWVNVPAQERVAIESWKRSAGT